MVKKTLRRSGAQGMSLCVPTRLREARCKIAHGPWLWAVFLWVRKSALLRPIDRPGSQTRYMPMLCKNAANSSASPS